ncbi:uncharacterized protein K02A2.6-like [Mizuhopecten yessoensis]|uniref:uncharacterized protein K02A2.6-like n=1 Tax=Mizuhopecten yessoensis TaxID=6573 RepID=UPI000B4582CB|nr:uncharacterized protein K02A2.6-like [Mizuhopecten yessoensis]
MVQMGQPVAYASRALTDMETRYAQIEKELLVVVFGMEKVHQFTYGRPVTVQSDHKSLEMILKKSLQNAPKRLQRFLLRLQKYNFVLTYKKGETMYLADTLSRAYLDVGDKTAQLDDTETVNMAQFLPISEPRLHEIQKQTSTDESLQTLREVILEGWPESKSKTPALAQPYFHVRDELAVQDGIIFRGERAVIPRTLRADIMQKIHSSHVGVEGCLRRARETVYWPRMNFEVRDYIEQCGVCRSFDTKQQKETLISHDVPDRPWAKLGSDLFYFDQKNYLITVDYFSNYWEIDYLQDTTSKTVIRALRSQFARHGIPDILCSDNGPQFSSDEFRRFSKEWEFDHVTSSPGYAQSNGKSEQAVKTAKRLMKLAKTSHKDPFLALLDFRNTPSQGMDSSPVQRLMNRRTKTLMPTKASLLKPEVQMSSNAKKQLKGVKERQAFYYNQTAKNLKPLGNGEVVRIAPHESMLNNQKTWKRGVVKEQVNKRSYDVTTEDGRTYRRNRRHLRLSKETFTPKVQDFGPNVEMEKEPHVAQESHVETSLVSPPEAPPNMSIRTRSGRQVALPSKFKDFDLSK